MKKLFISLVVVFIGFAVNAQNFNVGVSAGLPSGDVSDAYSFSAHLDASYLYEVSEGFHLGGATGFLYSFGDTVGPLEFEDLGIIPIAAAARYSISEQFSVGADLGYGIGVAPSGVDSGFYYAPRAQYNFSEQTSVVAAYRGVSVSGGSFDFLTLGIEFKL
jgi:hypothetical protein